jgi:hypothetical protein
VAQKLPSERELKIRAAAPTSKAKTAIVAHQETAMRDPKRHSFWRQRANRAGISVFYPRLGRPISLCCNKQARLYVRLKFCHQFSRC